MALGPPPSPQLHEEGLRRWPCPGHPVSWGGVGAGRHAFCTCIPSGGGGGGRPPPLLSSPPRHSNTHDTSVPGPGLLDLAFESLGPPFGNPCLATQQLYWSRLLLFSPKSPCSSRKLGAGSRSPAARASGDPAGAPPPAQGARSCPTSSQNPVCASGGACERCSSDRVARVLPPPNNPGNAAERRCHCLQQRWQPAGTLFLPQGRGGAGAAGVEAPCP